MRRSLAALAVFTLLALTGCAAYVEPAPVVYRPYYYDPYYGPYYGSSVVVVGGGYYHGGYYASRRYR